MSGTESDYPPLGPDAIPGDRFAADRALASGYVSFQQVLDPVVPIADLRADPLWEMDPILGDWFKRTPEFYLARAAAEEALIDQKAPAEIALAAALISLEPDLPPQRDGVPCPIAPNWQPYVVVSSEPVEGGRATRVGSSTSAQAIALWKRELLEFAAQHEGDTLWWRCRPEIIGCVPFGRTEAIWIVYSRLMIGNDPAKELQDRVTKGEVVPTPCDVKAGLISMEQINALGLVYCVVSDSYERPSAA